MMQHALVRTSVLCVVNRTAVCNEDSDMGAFCQPVHRAPQATEYTSCAGIAQVVSIGVTVPE